MSCDNDCGSATVVNNPCDYDNCGCLNPTTFKCTTYSGPDLVYVAKNGDDGDVILGKIDALFEDLISNKGKVLVDGDDSCTKLLEDALDAGTNISLQVVGTGCNRKLRIDSTTGGVAVDVNAKVSANDNTSGYLHAKTQDGDFIQRSIINPGGNEKLQFDVVISSLVSADSGNLLAVGTDGKLKTAFTEADGSETKVLEGTGIVITGAGTTTDPYVFSTNASIYAKRPCFDGVWRDVTVANITNPNVTVTSGKVQYRYRHDGTIEFRGNVTYGVAFGNYASSNRMYTITIGSIPTTCVTSNEQTGTFNLKSMHHIDIPQASSDQITQQYGYVIRKSGANLIVEFQSSFTNNTSKSVVVSFDGAVVHPNV
jgi:hypothetical protein